MPNTLFGRLILSSLLVIGVFFGALGYVTKTVFVKQVTDNKHEQLKLQNFILLTSTKIEDEGVLIEDELRESRFEDFESGLYGYITNHEGKILWRTYSAHSLNIDTKLLTPSKLEKGFREFITGPDYYRYSHTVLWELRDDEQEHLTFTVLEDRGPVLESIQEFQRRLVFWMLATGAILVVLLLLILRWGTRPLRQLTKKLKLVENGEQDRLDGDYPLELQRLVKNLNDLLITEKQQRERYHYTLADLAHSLKTPLAVIQAELEGNSGDGTVIADQVARMDEIIKHQLQRAVIVSPHNMGEKADVHDTAQRLINALEKVYSDRHIKFTLQTDEGMFFKGDKRDLTEVLGNLLDNACKHCTSNVMVSATTDRDSLIIGVHDDGFGIDADYREQLLKRGQRADTRYAGQGIGLDVARDIVTSYKGELAIADSPLGGALFQIRFPL